MDSLESETILDHTETMTLFTFEFSSDVEIKNIFQWLFRKGRDFSYDEKQVITQMYSEWKKKKRLEKEQVLFLRRCLDMVDRPEERVKH